MRKITADTYLFPKCLQSGSIGASLQIIEAEMAVHEVANRLHSRPSQRRLTKGSPGKIQQFAVDFAIAARQKERERFDRQIPDIVLRRVRYVPIQFAWVTHRCLIQKTNNSRRGVDPAAMIPELVHIFLDRHSRFSPKVFCFDQVPFARGVNVQDVNHGSWSSQTKRDIVTDP